MRGPGGATRLRACTAAGSNLRRALGKVFLRARNACQASNQPYHLQPHAAAPPLPSTSASLSARAWERPASCSVHHLFFFICLQLYFAFPDVALRTSTCTAGNLVAFALVSPRDRHLWLSLARIHAPLSTPPWLRAKGAAAAIIIARIFSHLTQHRQPIISTKHLISPRPPCPSGGDGSHPRSSCPSTMPETT